MKSVRPAVRKAAYHSGILGLARRGARSALTVAQFHRVIDADDPEFSCADPVYTVSTELFDNLLRFFQKHFEVVSLQDVVDARLCGRHLPKEALLITFDDGWADNLRYAAPMIRNYGLSAAVFAVGEAILSRENAWWQEQIFAAERAEYLRPWLARTEIRRALGGQRDETGPSSALAIVIRLAQIGEDERARLIALLPAPQTQSRMMLREDQLQELASYGITLAVHGFSHLPLTEIRDIGEDLARSSAVIERIPGAMTNVLALPHGRYDSRVVASARTAGMKLVFSSDTHLNRTEQGWLRNVQPLGRIGVVSSQISNRAGRFDSSAAARWFWARSLL